MAQDATLFPEDVSGGVATSSQTAAEQEQAQQEPEGVPKKATVKPTKKEAVAKQTPMMAQYHQAKSAYPDALLFFRMGDFYELFLEDAHKAAHALDIALTKRGQHQGQDIAMCGVPVEKRDIYLKRLIDKGFKVAVVEQIEDAQTAKEEKRLVKRDVVRLVTAGTLTEDSFLEAGAHNYLAAVVALRGMVACSWADISTGDFYVQAWKRGSEDIPQGLLAALARLRPNEILLPQAYNDNDSWRRALAPWWKAVTPQSEPMFDSKGGDTRLQALFGASFSLRRGDFTAAEVAAAGALLMYVQRTQKGTMPDLHALQSFKQADILAMDVTTLSNLEIVTNTQGQRKGSLLQTLDRTCTAAGARALARRLVEPSAIRSVIEERHKHVAFFHAHVDARAGILNVLTQTHDIERCLARLVLGRGGPQDLKAIGDTLLRVAVLLDMMQENAAPPALLAWHKAYVDVSGLRNELQEALKASVPLRASDGDFIKSSYHSGVNEFSMSHQESRRQIDVLGARYRDMLDIKSLKVLFSEQLGCFIEVPRQYGDLLDCYRQDGQRVFHRRQSTTHRMRFYSDELKKLEETMADSRQHLLSLEMEIFSELCALVCDKKEPLREVAQALAHIDVVASHAAFADERGWCCPQMQEGKEGKEGKNFCIVQGRHPVVESVRSDEFVANDCMLNEQERLWLVTGPNMAGKSTFLRQNALMIVLAQAGCFVPADKAQIGIADRLFSRVGAGDDLVRGDSTFMMEMKETALILLQATEKSFVILDEIGRGTAVNDGLALAWSVVEHVHNVNRCRGLFSTHYHELTAVQETLSALSLRQVQVEETKQGEVLFVHRVAEGAARASYGIHVARLAGVPHDVCARAQDVMAVLDSQKKDGEKTIPPPQKKKPPRLSQVERLLQDVIVDDMSPKEALDMLYRLKHSVQEQEES